MAIKHKTYAGNGNWRRKYYLAVVRLSDGRQISRSFSRLAEARTWEKDASRGVGLGQTKDLRLEKTTIESFAVYWLEHHGRVHKAPSSVKRDIQMLKLHILPRFGSLRLFQVTGAMVAEWISELRKKDLSPKTINNCLGLLKKLFNDAVRWNFLRYHQLGGVKKLVALKGGPRFWTAPQVSAFLAAFSIDEARWLPLFALALYAGLRKGEVRALTWDCVNFDLGFLAVFKSYCSTTKTIRNCTKSRRQRFLPMAHELREILVNERVRTKPVSTDPVVAPFNWWHPEHTLRRIARRAGIPEIRFHDLRHTFASNLVMGGRPIYDVQQLLGHANPMNTEIYAHLAPDYLRAAVDVLRWRSDSKTDGLSAPSVDPPRPGTLDTRGIQQGPSGPR